LIDPRANINMSLRQYIQQNDIHDIDTLIKKTLEENFLSEDLSNFQFDESENRFFDERIEINKFLFKQDFIKFRNSAKITIQDSIFIHDIDVHASLRPVNVFLYNCVILGRLGFVGNYINDIEITSCNFSSIGFFNSLISNCHIFDSKVGTLIIFDSRLDKLNLFCNTIYDIRKYQSRVNMQYSNGNTINIEGIINGEKTNDINLINFINTPVEVITESIEDPIKTKMETIKFLKEAGLFTKESRLERLANLELTLLSESSRFSKWLVKILSGFTKPLVFFNAGIFIILGFSIIYYFFGTLSAESENCISFWEAFYFSGVTFSTIGYGDLHPLGWTRTFAVIEGLLGIITCSGFLVSLVNKYTRDF